jgi:anti-sigma B factor antagonist
VQADRVKKSPAEDTPRSITSPLFDPTLVVNRMPSERSSRSAPPFRLSVNGSFDPAVVSLEGELDLAAAPQLRECLVGLVEGGATDIVLDVARLDFIDSTGLSVLVMALNRTRAVDGSTVLRNPSHSVMRLLEITGLLAVFGIEGEPLSEVGARHPEMEGSLSRSDGSA